MFFTEDMETYQKLQRDFFLRPTLEVAADLLGKYLVVQTSKGRIVGEINEVESYIGQNDPACHAAVGRTKRNEVMFWEGGYAYVYFTYGMYYCLNIVTEQRDFPSAVLIRSVLPVEGLDIMRKNRKKTPRTKITDDKNLVNGPGKLCQALGLDRNHNGVDVTSSDQIYLVDSLKKVKKFSRTPRIGISKGKNLKWRFYYS